MGAVGVRHSRRRRDSDEAESRTRSRPDRQPHRVDTDFKTSSTHGTVLPSTVTTSSSPSQSPSTHLRAEFHDKPLAVEPIGRSLPNNVRRNSPEDDGMSIIIILIILFHFLNVLVPTGFVLVGQNNNNNNNNNKTSVCCIL